MTTIVLLESSMRQFHKRHSICQTLITPVVPGSSYRLCTVPLVLPNEESQRHVREFVNPRLGCLSFPAGPDDKNYSFSAILHHAKPTASVSRYCVSDATPIVLQDRHGPISFYRRCGINGNRRGITKPDNALVSCQVLYNAELGSLHTRETRHASSCTCNHAVPIERIYKHEPTLTRPDNI